MRTINLIGFSGLAGSGKTHAADVLLSNHPFWRVSFAAPLKRMLSVLVPDLNDKNATPDVLGGCTVRHALQTLGTNWGRDMIHKDTWTNAAMNEARDVMIRGYGVVFDDVRFDNEAEAILNAGGVIIRINRPGVAQMAHASELGVSDHLITTTIDNNSSEADLRDKILSAFNWLN